jgi:dihydrofolate synthase / folylpolyglutamate synthase
MDYQSCLEFLSQFHTKESPHENNRHLHVMEELFQVFQVDHSQMNIIQITGSCGKGSTAAFLSSILNASQISHGLFTGPHLICYEERFVIDNQMITQDEFTEIIEEIIEKTSEFDMQDVGHKHLMTLIAMLWFSRKEVPLVIFENGAGGASDPSNVFNPMIACLTEITLDHTHLLGETIEAITKDKAAIFKDSVKVPVCGMMNDVARKYLLDLESHFNRTFNFIYRDYDISLTCEGLTYKSALNVLTHLELGLSGEHQWQNAANALRMAEGLVELGYTINRGALINGLKQTILPGRFETFEEDDIKLILDGAHNPLELKALSRSLYKKRMDPQVILVSFASKKNVEEMLLALNKKNANYVIAPSPFIARQQARDAVEKVFKKLNLTYSYCDNVEDALTTARRRVTNGTILVTGSLYLVGRVRELLLKRKRFGE